MNQKLYPQSNIILENSPTSSAEHIQAITAVTDLQKTITASLPKILWIKTFQNLSNLNLVDYALAHHIMAMANKSNLQLRLINDFNSYEWFSSQKRRQISIAMHNSKYMVSVSDLNRLAFLIQHGGVSVAVSDRMFIDNFDWVHQYFINTTSSDPCTVPTQLFLFEQPQNQKLKYNTFFIAVKPQSSILKSIYNQLLTIIESGFWPYKHQVMIESRDAQNNGVVLKEPFQALLNIVIRRQQAKHSEKCKQKPYGGIRSINVKYIQKILPIQNSINLLMKWDRADFTAKQIKYFIPFKRQIVEANILQVINSGDISNYHPNSIMLNDLLMTEGVKKYMRPVPPNRQVHLCLVSLKQTNKLSDIERSFDRLKQQNINNWTAVYFTTEPLFMDNQSNNLPIIPMKSQIEQQKIIPKFIVKGSGSQGLNLQRAVTLKCPVKSIIMLLDFDEQLKSNDALSLIQTSFIVRKVFGGFVDLIQTVQDKEVLHACRNQTKYDRMQLSPNKSNLQWLRNHFRIFNSDLYKFIPHYDLHSGDGFYYDRLAALQAMIEIGAPSLANSNFKFMMRVIQEYMDLPQQAVVLHKVAIVVKEIVQITDLMQHNIYGKYHYFPFDKTLLMINQNPTRLMVFNKGVQFMGPAGRSQMQKLIPKKIHQIWIRGEIPAHKQIMMNQNKRLHPDYEFNLWSQQNITKQNFPLTFDIIQTLLNFNKISHHNMMAAVSDYMRYQIIYKHGGFHLDTNFYFLKNYTLQSWRTYKLIIGGQLYNRDRHYKGSSFFGAVPNYLPLLRLISDVNLNTRNIYSHRVGLWSGPGYISRMVQEQEEFDQDILILSFEQLYPFYPYEGNPITNACQIKNYKKGDPNTLFEVNGKGYSKNCSKIFQFAYSVDHYDIGASWNRKRKDRPLIVPRYLSYSAADVIVAK